MGKTEIKLHLVGKTGLYDGKSGNILVVGSAGLNLVGRLKKMMEKNVE